MPNSRTHNLWIYALVLSIASAFVVKKAMGIGLFICFIYALTALRHSVQLKGKLTSGQLVPAPLPLAIRCLVWVLCAPFLWVLLLGILRWHVDLEQLTEYLSHLMAAAVLCVYYGRVKSEHWAAFKALIALASLVLLPMTLWEMPHPVWQERYATYFVDPNSLGIAGFIFGSALGVAVFQKNSWATDAKTLRLPEKVWVLLLFVGACAAWLVSGLSGTRGAWLAAAPALLILVSVAKNRMKVIAATLVLGSLGLLAASQTPMLVNRYQAAVKDISDLQNHGSRDSSLGTRLSIYEALISVTLESPWLGMDREEMKSRIRALSTLSTLNKETLLESGAHNQYLEKQVLNGLPGLLMALLLYFVPLIYFWKRLMDARISPTRTPDVNAFVYASGLGLIVCIAFATAGLSLVLTLKYLNSFWAACVALAAATVPVVANQSDLCDGASHV